LYEGFLLLPKQGVLVEARLNTKQVGAGCGTPDTAERIERVGGRLQIKVLFYIFAIRESPRSVS